MAIIDTTATSSDVAIWLQKPPETTNQEQLRAEDAFRLWPAKAGWRNGAAGSENKE